MMGGVGSVHALVCLSVLVSLKLSSVLHLRFRRD